MYRPRSKTLIALTLSGLLATAPAFADEPTDSQLEKEHIGLGAGALFGAIAGGPPGAIIGAIGGALTGRLQDSEDQLAAQQRELQQSREDKQQLEQQLQQARQETRRAAETASRQTTQASVALSKHFVYAVQFRSNSAELEPHYRPQLEKLAQLMAVFADLKVQLDGQTDVRGSDQQNLQLAQDRVDAVSRYLQQHGVAGDRILPLALGEQPSSIPSGDVEGMFFERRVQISFRIDRQPS